MIIGFEEYTHELTPKEIEFIVPRVIKILLERKGKKNVATNIKMVSYLNSLPAIIENKAKTTTPRIRKVIHAIRVSGAVPLLIATSDGYYIAETEEELTTYLVSLKERINSIQEVYSALKKQQYDKQLSL